MVNSVPREGGQYRLPEGGSAGGPGPQNVAYVFVSRGSVITHRLYELTHFRQSPSHSATDSQSFRFRANIFSPSAPPAGP